jgi:hypothetical protein
MRKKKVDLKMSSFFRGLFNESNDGEGGAIKVERHHELDGGYWMFIDKDVSGETQRDVVIVYRQAPLWRQEKYGRLVLAPAAGALGGACFVLGNKQEKMSTKTLLRALGTSLVVFATYKAFVDGYNDDHGRQIERKRRQLAANRSFQAWSDMFGAADSSFSTTLLFDDHEDQHIDSSEAKKQASGGDDDNGDENNNSNTAAATTTTTTSKKKQKKRNDDAKVDSKAQKRSATNAVPVCDLLTPCERGAFYIANAVDLSRLQIDGNPLANLSGLLASNSISRMRYEGYRRVAEQWASKEQAKAQQQSRIENEYDDQIAEPLHAQNGDIEDALRRYDNTQCVIELEAARERLRCAIEAIKQRSELHGAVIDALPPAIDPTSPSAPSNLKHALANLVDAETTHACAEFERERAALHTCVQNAAVERDQRIERAHDTFAHDTLVARSRRTRLLDDMNDEFSRLDQKLNRQLEDRADQATAHEHQTNFEPPRFTLHSSIPESHRDQVLLKTCSWIDRHLG